MIGIAIGILTLFLALYDKPSLFTRPVKPWKIFIILAIIATSIFSAVKELKSDAMQDHSSAVIDSLNGKADGLKDVILMLSKTNDLAHKEHQDSLKNFHYRTVEILARYGLRVDTLTGTIKSLNEKVTKEAPPTLRVVEYPILKKNTGTDEEVFAYKLQALNADAHIVDYRYIFINMNANRNLDKPEIILGGYMNHTTVIPKGEAEPNERIVFIERGASVSDPFILAIEIDYKSKGNEKQLPVRKIYEVSISKHTVREMDNSQYLTVSNHFKKYKIWED